MCRRLSYLTVLLQTKRTFSQHDHIHADDPLTNYVSHQRFPKSTSEKPWQEQVAAIEHPNTANDVPRTTTLIRCYWELTYYWSYSCSPSNRTSIQDSPAFQHDITDSLMRTDTTNKPSLDLRSRKYPDRFLFDLPVDCERYYCGFANSYSQMCSTQEWHLTTDWHQQLDPFDWTRLCSICMNA